MANGNPLTTTGTPEDLYVGGVTEATAAEKAAEALQARRLAERYRLPFIDLSQANLDHDLFRSIPADLMLRYGFVPYRREGSTLVIVVSDPTDLPMIDELAVLLGTPIRVTVGTASAIQAMLKKSESSTRVLEEATESFQLQILREDEAGEVEDRVMEPRKTTGEQSRRERRDRGEEHRGLEDDRYVGRDREERPSADV